MFKYYDVNGALQQVKAGHGDNELSAEAMFAESAAANVTPVEWINARYQDADVGRFGTAFQQMQASLGIQRKGSKPNMFGLRPTSMKALLEGSFMAANVQQNSTPFGTASRAFTMISLVEAIESAVPKDRTTDINVFYSMVATELAIGSETFEQPVINYGTLNGPEQATAVRAGQGSLPPKMAFFSTSDRIRRIGSWTIGMEWTEQALKATTLDYVSLTVGRYLQVERDARAYRYISDLFNGNADLIVGAVSAVTSVSLDAASTGGVLTHKAWVKFLARNRKLRKITHAIMDHDTYLKLEGRTGRPVTNNYDPSLVAIDPQARMINSTFGGEVKVFLVDPATAGGPVPANTIFALDASAAISLVRNTNAAYQAMEKYAMKRTEAMRMDWSEEVFRTFGDTDLSLFDALTISA